MRIKKRGTIIRTAAGLLSAVIFACSFPMLPAKAGPELRIEQARQLALSKSFELTKISNKILLQQMKYTESVKAIKAKTKNLRSFRYTPLLSFKFPERLNMVEEYDLTTKPLVLQSEITTLKHQREDLRYKVLCDVNKAFVSVYISQQKLLFTNDMLALARNELNRNRVRFLMGEASQNDITTMEKNISKLEKDVASEQKALQKAKQSLTGIIGLDVTTSYSFANPMVSLSLPREQLEDIVTYSLNMDQTCYEARMTVSTTRLNLDSYETLMRKQYGGKMDMISVYLSSARSGQEIDYAAFQIQYNEMLKSFDEPWNKSIKILFFTFTLEWFKGRISGTRYIEDEMYAIYTACMEYAMALKERDNAEKSLRRQVEDFYESLVSTKGAYDSLTESTADNMRELEKMTALNKLGKSTYNEVKDKRTSYQEMQLESLDMLATYNQLLWDFDRLTCGAVTKLMKGERLQADAGWDIDSYLDEELVDKPIYYIYLNVESLLFQFGVEIPDDFEPEITHYEILYEGTRLGQRKTIKEPLRHLTLDYGETSMLTVRFFNEDSYVDECDIDTTVPRDVLQLKRAEPPVQAPEYKVIGTYTVSEGGAEAVSKISLSITDLPEAVWYSIGMDAQKALLDGGMIAVDQPFTYLALLESSLADVQIPLYGQNRQLLHTARLDTEEQTILIPAN